VLLIVPLALEYPTINDKLFSVVNRIANKSAVAEALIISTEAFADIESPTTETSVALSNRLLRFCSENFH